jgi:hypothetical protein
VPVGPVGSNGFFTGPVTVDFAASEPGYSPAQLTTYFRVNGGALQSGNALALTNNGIDTVQYYSVDPAHVAGPTGTLVVKIDQTPPSMTIAANPTVLWPPNHKLVPVTVGGFIADGISGVARAVSYQVIDEYGVMNQAGFAPVAVNPADTFGAYSFTVDLQSSRAGNDFDGRQYVIVVTGLNNAGDHTTVATVVTVPHDMGLHLGGGPGGHAGQRGARTSFQAPALPVTPAPVSAPPTPVGVGAPVTIVLPGPDSGNGHGGGHGQGHGNGNGNGHANGHGGGHGNGHGHGH